ncbi:anhydro-N-acetylmuramic acid kinase [Pelomonas sp. SE-A7]|uniref:anhydro-N-acetylmuramic acid kinase n=1 Tax=Pelomonas sp. SE-A7 TaxID=3054953 RepID=UPI00259C9BDE|nr:anhydro-N-acetylmuramic acid kinase [Pelomonas sp. SE-A7]MDM4766439.1 anhydro-N-acetylmuramic acid kinase [Pelomonas sp. SE-A7]
MPGLYLGLMSGTSLDGVDAVLARFPTQDRIEVLAHCHQPFEAELRAELLALNAAGPNEAHRMALAANAVARCYAAVAGQAMDGITESVQALGAHGQTIRHQPLAFDGCGYSIQLLNGSLLAELTGVDVVCDFRNRDLAAGGQGAPLVPAFHRALFGQAGRDIVALNIGGFSNVSLLGADGSTRGFDCGPGNCLMDLWIAERRGLPYDADGAWAASGQVLSALLQAQLAEPWFALPPPRSTGRDLFSLDWLLGHVNKHAPGAKPEDIQATLLELTVETIAPHVGTPAELLVCGGGALNGRLMQRLQQRLPSTLVLSTAARGLPPMQVEAAAFAWLAKRFVKREPGNLEAVTGARGPRMLGALYPA